MMEFNGVYSPWNQIRSLATLYQSARLNGTNNQKDSLDIGGVG